MTEFETHRADLEHFLEGSRRELHRYCARLTGSVFDGEDVVQDVMVRALAAAESRPTGVPLRAWLFRIAHNRAVDVVRTRMTRDRLASHYEEVEVSADTPFDAAARSEAVTLAIENLLDLPPIQRSVVVLKDVLEESNEDIATILGLTLNSVKAHLHRGRVRVRALAERPRPPLPKAVPHAETRLYIDLFNARDWKGLQELLSNNVRLVQSAKATAFGRKAVAARFFAGYAASADWRMRWASVEGREVVWVESEPDTENYFMTLTWEKGRLALITDFRYARYITRDTTPTF